MNDAIGNDQSAGNGPDNPGHYRVLARKYRPRTFSELIGQDAMVRTLSNAIESGRLAHAFVLTGVRGIGKTSTARLIARALNCIGPDGKGGPTVDPCGVCDPCRAIAESRHVDVLEMDAASRTGVDDIREIIDGVRYSPVSARYKIYIIDEVHMLTRNAFNALLKTLEEPPEHVKFLFATTEIRKLPVTVLSRCQRFDLRRVETGTLINHFRRIAELEGCTIDDASLALIARAAEGSVRDGLSLLDQAIAHGAGVVTEQQVRDMLGLADRARVLDLYRAVMAGDIVAALGNLRDQYNLGADPVVILQDMLELTHWITRLKVVPDAGEDAVTSEAERREGGELAQRLSIPVLTRAWQMLIKGLEETRVAPSPITAAEMVLVRLCHVADLPTPGDLVKRLTENGALDRRPPPMPSGGGQGPQAMGRSITDNGAGSANETSLALNYDRVPQASAQPEIRINSFQELVALFEDRREALIAQQLTDYVRLVSFAPGKLEIRLEDGASPDLPNRVSSLLRQWTGRQWVVLLSREEGEASLRAQELAAEARLRAEVEAHPLVREILQTFPGAAISDIQQRNDAEDLGADGECLADMAVYGDDSHMFGLDDD